MVRLILLVFRIGFHPGQIQDKILCCILLFTVKSFLSHNDLRFKATHCMIRPILEVTCIAFHPGWIPLPPCLPIQSNPMLCTTKIGLITQSSQLYNIPLDGKTNFGSVQHRISSWMNHLSGRQACQLHGKTNFRSIQHRISSWMDHLSSRQAIFGLNPLNIH